MNLNLTNNFRYYAYLFLIIILYSLSIYYIENYETFQNDNEYGTYINNIDEIFDVTQESIGKAIEKTDQTEIVSKEMLQLLENYRIVNKKDILLDQSNQEIKSELQTISIPVVQPSTQIQTPPSTQISTPTSTQIPTPSQLKPIPPKSFSEELEISKYITYIIIFGVLIFVLVLYFLYKKNNKK